MVRLFGSEAEYSLSALDQGRRVDQGLALRRLFDLARATLTHLPDLESSGMFLGNSFRLYADCEKVEAAGPEVIQPWDAVRYTRAGERILAGLAEQMSSADRLEVVLSRCNIGYGSQPTTWAFHLSIAHRVEPRRLIAPLTAHLISRLPYAGAGGFNNRAAGIRFMVSPRAAHITTDMSGESTHNRGIIHLRNEPLCCDHNRLHILTGENLCSDLSLWLTIAMTVLVVALAEADAWTDGDPRFLNPVLLLHAVAYDTTGNHQFTSVDGRRWTANSLQQYILQRIEQRFDHPAMPNWAPDVVERCAAVLRLLRDSPVDLRSSLDWCIKQAIFQQWVEKRGVNWRQLPDWNHILEVLRSALRRASGDEVWHLTADVLSSNSPAASAVRQLTPFLQSRGLDWEHLETVLDLRQQLFELDSRFGELRPQSIFHKLDSCGQLHHHVDGVCRIDQAMVEPPEGSRASLRGRLVQQLFPQRNEYACDWQSIQHLNSGRYLDLSSSLASEESWQDNGVGSRPAQRATEIYQRLREATTSSRVRRVHTHRQALRLYRQGSYKRSEELLESLSFSDLPNESRRLLVWVRARRGHQLEPEILRQLHPDSAAPPLWWIVDQIFVARFSHGLQPHPQTATWMQCGTDTLARTSRSSELQVEIFREHQANWLMHQHQLPAAQELLLPICRRWLGRENCPAHLGRALCTLSEIHRRQADLTTATRLQVQAERVLRTHETYGDVAEFALTARARLQSDSDPDESLRAIEEALHLQARQGNRVGQARSLLLLARLTTGRSRRRSAKRQLQLLQQQCPALQHCSLLSGILRAWRRWTHRRRTPDEHGNVFWGV